MAGSPNTRENWFSSRPRDADGNLYVADGKDRVSRVDAGRTGAITTIAGTGVAGFSGDLDLATKAQLNGPRDVAVDAAGNVFIADTGNARIRRVDTQMRKITTYAGKAAGHNSAGDGGPATEAYFSEPYAVGVDGGGNVYVVDSIASTVRKIDAATKFIARVAGSYQGGFSGDGGAAASAKLSRPTNIAFGPSNDLFITDSGNLRVRQVRANGTIAPPLRGTAAAGMSATNSNRHLKSACSHSV